MQIIVNSHVFNFNSMPTVGAIKEQFHHVESIPLELISLSFNGLSLSDECILDEENTCILRATVLNGLCGGKGGFGAMLRSLAKQKGKTKTTDFGACRDLSGRRLRHINDEIILNKWKEAKDRGEQFDTEEETATGIDLWYLSAPSWAEGIKVDKRKKFMKPRMKTSLCIDWLRARETKDAPSGAPVHWGCPRGARCEFAHGEDELKGEALAAMKESKAQAKTDEVTRKRGDYLNVISRAAKDDEEVGELVLAGLRAAKRSKMNELRKTTVSVETEHLPDKVTIASSSSSSSTNSKVEHRTEDEVVDSSGANLVRSRSVGEVNVDCAQFSVKGLCAFGTACAPHCVATEGGWYYEVELRSDGLMQIGWVSNAFAPRAAVEGDGVGDDAHSWAYDGYRQKAWHRGVEQEYGPQTGEIWRAGDVVGCYLHLDCAAGRGSVSYSLNGVVFGPAFELQLGDEASSFSPALSLESEESATINLGQEAFAFPPKVSSSEETEKAASKSDKTSVEYRPVWLSIDPQMLQLNGFAPVLEEKVSITSDYLSIGENEISSNQNVMLTSISDSAVAAVATVASVIVPVVKSAALPPTVASQPVLEDIDLSAPQFNNLDSLTGLGMCQLRHELEKRGLKTGGTAVERAQRLLVVRGLREGETVDKKLLVKPSKDVASN